MGSCSTKIGNVDLEAEMTPDMLVFHIKNIHLYNRETKNKVNEKLIKYLTEPLPLDKPKLIRQTNAIPNDVIGITQSNQPTPFGHSL